MTERLDALLEAGERALRRAGARTWEVCVTDEESASVEVIDGEVRAEESGRECAIGLRVLDGGIGFAGAADPTPEALTRAANAAVAEARLVRRAALAAFAAPRGGTAGEAGAAFDDARATARIGPRLVEAARALDGATRAADRRVVGVRPALVMEARGRFRLRTSGGLDVAETSSRAYASVAALARWPRPAETQMAQASASAGACEGIDLRALGARAGRRAVDRLGARGFKTAVVPVIFAPEVVAELLDVVIAALAGDTIDRGASFLARALDAPIFGEAFTLIDDPHDPGLDGAAWYDGEGLATRRTILIEAGRVRAVLDDLETAARGSRAPGAHAQRASAEGRPHPGAHALVLAPGTEPTASLLAAAKGGLWIDEVSGAHTISEITGALSLGAVGRRIGPGGTLGAPVEGITLSGTLAELLGPRARPGADLELLGPARVPPVLVEGVQVASGG